MNLLKSDGFRWFAGAFIVGATIPLVASATDKFKDLEISSGRFKFSGASAWIVAALVCGLGSGILGLGATLTKRRT